MVTCYMVTNDTLSNCCVQAGKVSPRAVCLWEPLRARAKTQWETSSSRWQPATATGDQRPEIVRDVWTSQVILQPRHSVNPSDATISGQVSIRLSEAWKCSDCSGPEGQWGAVWGAARPGRGQWGWGEARWAPSLQTSWPSTRSPVTWDSWTERICTFSFRWDFPLFTINLLLFVLFPRPPEQFECVFTSCCMRQWGIYPCWTWQTLWHD